MEEQQTYFVFETVMTYAIDEANHSNAKLLNKIKLDEDEFYRSLYVSRKKETELYYKVENGSGLFCVIGFPGSGKTSIINRVIKRFKEDNAYCFSIDFRKEEGSSPKKLLMDPMGTEGYLNNWLYSEILKQIQHEDIKNVDILKFYLDARNQEFLLSSDFTNADFVMRYQKAWDQYQKEGAGSVFKDWIFDDKARIGIIDEMVKKLRPQDYLYYLVNRDKKGARQCIITLDNTDSIQNDIIRKNIFQCAIYLQAMVRQSAKVILALRNTNFWQDRPDKDANKYIPIEINYKEFINQEIYNEEIEKINQQKGYVNEIDKDYIENKLIHATRAEFAKRIVDYRFTFIDTQIRKEVYLDYNLEEYTSIEKLFKRLISIEHIHSAAYELSNGDTRKMLIHISNFAEYYVYKVKYDIDGMSLREDEKNFILESYFYGWIIQNDKMFKTDMYNVVKDMMEWYTTKDSIGCMINHLIISYLGNMTNFNRGFEGDLKRINVGAVLDKFEEMGYEREFIRGVLFNLYGSNKDDGDFEYHGFLESNKYELIKIEDLTDDTYIWLTNRPIYLCKYASLKFLYQIALLRKQKFKVNNAIFSYSDKEPITKTTIYANLIYLCKLASKHLNGLKMIQSRQKKTNEWFMNYRKELCIRTNINPWKDSFGNLQFDNIIGSHIKFLGHQQHIEGSSGKELNPNPIISDEMIEEYQKLRDKYMSYVKKLMRNEDIGNINDDEFHNNINHVIFDNTKQTAPTATTGVTQ